MMRQALLVAAGGAAGSVLRFLCQRALNTAVLPYGTLTVNLAGCFLIGLFYGLLQKETLSPSNYLLLATGLCGGFTTFSAFSQESLLLLTQERWATFLFYVLGSVAAGLLATFAGYKLIT